MEMVLSKVFPGVRRDYEIPKGAPPPPGFILRALPEFSGPFAIQIAEFREHRAPVLPLPTSFLS